MKAIQTLFLPGRVVKPSFGFLQGYSYLSYNLFIAYDLLPPVQDYDAVHSAIKSLGAWHQFQQSFWYVHTQYDPGQAYQIVARAMTARDKLAVINAESGIVSNWDHPPIEAINAIWAER
jgi:hypothetical protein